MDQNLYDICRLCMDNDPKTQKLSIFGKANSFKISDMVLCCLNIRVTSSDKFTSICMECIVTIDKMFGWYSKFRETDRKFNEMLKKKQGLRGDEKKKQPRDGQKNVTATKNNSNNKKAKRKTEDKGMRQLESPTVVEEDVQIVEESEIEEEDDMMEEIKTEEDIEFEGYDVIEDVNEIEDDVEVDEYEEYIENDRTLPLEEEPIEEDTPIVGNVFEFFSDFKLCVSDEEDGNESNEDLVKATAMPTKTIKTDVEPATKTNPRLTDILLRSPTASTSFQPIKNTIGFTFFNQKQNADSPTGSKEPLKMICLPKIAIKQTKKISSSPMPSLKMPIDNDHTYSNDDMNSPIVVSKPKKLSSSCFEPPYEDPENKCFICNVVFDSDASLAEHFPSHFPDLPYNCEKCSLTLITVRNLNNHLKFHDENRPFKCEMCEKRFKTMVNMRAHLHKQHKPTLDFSKRPRNLQCCHCGLKFVARRTLLHHERTHGENKPTKKFTCKVCGLQLSSYAHMIRHNFLHTGERPHKCDQCKKSFTEKHSLTLHKETHATEKPYSCSYCSKVFSNTYTLNFHKKKHFTNKQTKQTVRKARKVRVNSGYTCPECASTFPRNAECIAHMDKHHPDTEFKFVFCTMETCGQRFLTQQNQKSHFYLKHIDRDSKLHQCSHCPKKLTTLKQLEYHENMHLGILNYECNLCEKKFPGAPHLQKHLRTHADIRPYDCDFCDKSFKKLDTYKVHRRIHTGEKPYSCSQCERSFTDPSTLSKHKKIHLNNASDFF